MFKGFVNNTIFTDNRKAITNITERGSSLDGSFYSTACALLLEKVQDNLEIHYRNKSYGMSSINGSNPRTIVYCLCDESDFLRSTNKLVIHNLNIRESSEAMFNIIRAEFCNFYDGFVRLPKVTDYYSKKFAVDCYINPEKKISAVFVDCLDERKFHAIQASIPVFMPWYFNAEGLSEDEMALIDTLIKNSMENYLSALNKLAEKYNIRDISIRRMLAGFETNYERKLLIDLKAQYESYGRKIMDYYTRISDCAAQQRDCSYKITGLEEKINSVSEESEIMNYFLHNKALHLVNATDDYIEFVIDTYLEYFDRDIAETAINNENSIVYSGHNDSSSKRMKKFMTEIFLSDSPRMKLKFCAAYRIKLATIVDPLESYSYGSGFEHSMPNPHINNYGCMGDYLRIINELVVKSDYISAIAQCVASAMSLNFGDGYVMGDFMSYIWRANTQHTRVVELYDGTYMNIPEAIEWLERQEETEHTNEVEESEEA